MACCNHKLETNVCGKSKTWYVGLGEPIHRKTKIYIYIYKYIFIYGQISKLWINILENINIYIYIYTYIYIFVVPIVYSL